MRIQSVYTTSDLLKFVMTAITTIIISVFRTVLGTQWAIVIVIIKMTMAINNIVIIIYVFYIINYIPFYLYKFLCTDGQQT